MSVSIRAATLADRRQMAALIGASSHALAEWMDNDSAFSAWFVAEDETGQILGLQRVGPGEALPPEACEIATFVTEGPLRLTVGSRLFDESAEAARLLGFLWVAALLDPANDGARTYYQSRGFLAAGGEEKLLMRYDLD